MAVTRGEKANLAPRDSKVLIYNILG